MAGFHIGFDIVIEPRPAVFGNQLGVGVGFFHHDPPEIGDGSVKVQTGRRKLASPAPARDLRRKTGCPALQEGTGGNPVQPEEEAAFRQAPGPIHHAGAMQQDAGIGKDHFFIGEKRGDDSAEDHSHQYDLRDPLPAAVAEQELQFFLSRMAQDLVEIEPDPEIPPGEIPPK